MYTPINALRLARAGIKKLDQAITRDAEDAATGLMSTEQSASVETDPLVSTVDALDEAYSEVPGYSSIRTQAEPQSDADSRVYNMWRVGEVPADVPAVALRSLIRFNPTSSMLGRMAQSQISDAVEEGTFTRNEDKEPETGLERFLDDPLGSVANFFVPPAGAQTEDDGLTAHLEQQPGVGVEAGLMARSTVDDGTSLSSQQDLVDMFNNNIIMSDPTLRAVVAVEGFDGKPIEHNSNTRLSPGSHKSGLTVGPGLDVGQYDAAGLRRMGLSEEIIAEFGDWVGLNPDTITDPDTGRPAANRTRGHQLMAQEYARQEENGTLPSFTFDDMSEITNNVYDYAGVQVARRQYNRDRTTGVDFDSLDPDVQYVLAQDALNTGRVTGTMIARARRGEGALQVLQGMGMMGPRFRQTRRANVRDFLNRNSFDDPVQMSDQGLQYLTNKLIDLYDVEADPLVVDADAGPATRRGVDAVLRSQGITPPTGRSINQRKEALAELVLGNASRALRL